MATYVPAIKARMGDLDYYISVVTLGEAARLIDYVEEVDGWTAETPSELKLQRKLNIQRVEREMVPYLLSDSDHFYSALTVEVRGVSFDDNAETFHFQPKDSFPGGLEFGTLTLDGTESLCALDGQHRLKSIELSIRQNPQLAREHIALILVPFKSTTRSQTLFSDLNRYAKSPSKSMSLLFTHRERLARITKLVANEVPLLRDRVNMESTSLSSKSRHFITLSTLYEMTKVLLGQEEIAEEKEKTTVKRLLRIWQTLSRAIPEWRLVATSKEHPAYLRQRYLDMHGVGQQAVAIATATARISLRRDWTEAVDRLGKVDWRLTNPEWDGVALQGGRVNNTSTSIRLLASTLMKQMKLPTIKNAGTVA